MLATIASDAPTVQVRPFFCLFQTISLPYLAAYTMPSFSPPIIRKTQKNKQIPKFKSESKTKLKSKTLCVREKPSTPSPARMTSPTPTPMDCYSRDAIFKVQRSFQAAYLAIDFHVCGYNSRKQAQNVRNVNLKVEEVS